MKIDRIDHFVLTVRDVEATCAFYSRVLGMEVVRFGEGRTALTFGRQKINLHQAGREFVPHAANPAAGGGDFCLSAEPPNREVAQHLETIGISIELGPQQKTGAPEQIGRASWCARVCPEV